MDASILDRIRAWDLHVFRKINGGSGTWMAVLSRLTHAGGHQAWSVVMLGAIVVGTFTLPPEWQHVRAAAWMMARLILGNTCSLLLVHVIVKRRVNRIRPYLALDDVVLREKESNARGGSFPSGHTQFTLANSLAMALVTGSLVPGSLPWLVAAAIAFSTVIAVSRVACGVHYPTDVIGGFATGALILGLTLLVMYPFLTWFFAAIRGLFPW